MSELLNKILCDEVNVEDILVWFCKNDVTTFKHGVNQFDFSSYLLEFLREHTRPLLSAQESKNDARSPNTSVKNETSNVERSSMIKSSDSFNSSLNEKSFPSLKSPSIFNSNHDDRNKFFSRSPLNCSSPLENRSKNDEKRSPYIRLTSTPSPKPMQLGDFMVAKKITPKRKAKKRVQLVSSGNENLSTSGNDCSNMSSPKSLEAEIEATNSSEIELLKLNERHRSLIKKLALLYSRIISSNFIQDLVKELNYVMSLLTIDSDINCEPEKYSCICNKHQISRILESDFKESCLFKRTSEMIFFACVVLENQWGLLKYFSKSMLNVLSDNQSICVFAPKLEEKIVSFLNSNKTDHQNVNILHREMFVDTVKFKMDTDSRPNYANDELFHAFKKQRDEFYGLLHEWEESMHHQPSTEFFKAKHKRLRAIFTVSSATTNMCRLAELFVSQILASVFNENSESCERLGIPMTKFDLLNRRFITPCSIVVGNDKRFPGVQEFFKDFLRSAENSFFCTHVQNVLVHHIVLLNNFQFSCDVTVALEKQELFLMCINKLCLLAKFLSLITFLPYQDDYDLPLDFRIPLTEFRKEVPPPLDLNQCLTESMNSGRLIITIPWIVEFLNGIDNTSILLPYYKTIFVKLQYLLYALKLPFSDELVHSKLFLLYSEDAKKEGNSKSSIEKKSKIACSTELKNLVANQNEFDERFVDECLQTINCSQILITLYVNSLFNNVSVSTIIKMEDVSKSTENPILISSEFYIGEMALYQCCPQLHELKHLLEGNKKLAYKSVIPKMEKTFCEQENDPKAVDVQLEMHFFDNMPKSVKNSVDFVAERIASLCVKSIRQKIIPSLKTEILEQFKKLLSGNHPEDVLMDHILAKFYSLLKCGVKGELSKFSKNIDISIRGLIGAEVPDECALTICIDITCRKCLEIVYNWIFNYINIKEMIKKERENASEQIKVQANNSKALNEKKSKKSKNDCKKNDFQDWVSKRSQHDQSNVPTPVKALHDLRHLIRMILNCCNTDSVSFAEISDALIVCSTCIEQSPDLQFLVFRRLMMLSLELCIILVYFRPDLVNNALLEKFGKFWSFRKICNLHLPFEQILSYRNMDYFGKSYSLKCLPVQKALTKFLVYTVNNDFLHVSRLLSQILKLGRREWSNELLIEISNSLNDVLKNTESGQEKIKSALEWIANFIVDDSEFM